MGQWLPDIASVALTVLPSLQTHIQYASCRATFTRYSLTAVSPPATHTAAEDNNHLHHFSMTKASFSSSWYGPLHTLLSARLQSQQGPWRWQVMVLAYASLLHCMECGVVLGVVISLLPPAWTSRYELQHPAFNLASLTKPVSSEPSTLTSTCMLQVKCTAYSLATPSNHTHHRTK